MKHTKHKLLSSIATLFVCLAMFIGSTYAWFTDSASTGVNKIQAGNLDIEVEYLKTDGSWASIQDATTLFNPDLWEPGHTEYVTLQVKNNGTLALRYKVLVSPVSENGGINVYNQNFKLSDYLKFATSTPSETQPTYADRDSARSAVGSGVAISGDGLNKEGTILAGGNPQYVTLVVYMPEDVDNYANAKPGTTAPSIDLGITVKATQVENESDSFDQNYDAGAKNDAFFTPGSYYDYFEAVNVSATALADGTFTVTKTDSITGVIASASGTATAGNTVDMVITKTFTPAGNFGISVDEGHELNGYDIKVSGQTEGSLVQGQLYVGTGLDNFVFYHNSVAMTHGTQGSLTDGQYFYNSTDGYVYFATVSFSPFQATYKAPAASIGTAVYGTVEDAFAAVKNNETITLLKDSAGNGLKVESGKVFTVDFNNHTYDINGELVGSTGTETNSLQLLKDSTIIFKNGKLTSTQTKYQSQILIQNYSNLTLDNMVVTAGVPFDYILSNNNGNITIKDTTLTAAEGKVAFDVCRYSSYVGPSVTVEGNSVINGNVEISSSGAKEGAVHELTVTGGTFNGRIYKAGDSPDFVGNITGGIYAEDPNEFVADGHCALLEGNRYYITVGTVVSNKNEFAEALSSTVNNIYFKNDISVGSSLTVNRDVNIYGQGYTLTAYYAKPVIKITGEIEMKMSDVNIVFPSYTSGVGIEAVGKVNKLTFENVNITNAFKAIHFNDCRNTKVSIINCNLTSIYPFNVNGGNVSEFVVENSSLNGWTSFSNSSLISEYKFKNCNFGMGMDYATVKPYGNTSFEDCTFSYDYFENLEGGIASGTNTPITVKFNDCSMVTVDGITQPLTVELLKTAFNYEITSGSNSGDSTINDQYWFVNGEQVSFVTAE